MKNKIYLIIVALSSSFLLSINSLCNNDSIIYWDNNRPLKWEDFRDTEPDLLIKKTSAFLSATSSLCIDYDRNSYGSYLTYFTIIAVFNKNQSWIKDSISNNLLKHEQLHFDITELYARKIRKELIYAIDNYISVVICDSIFKAMYAEMLEKQSKYDKETSHGTIVEKQIEWEEYIQNELAKLEEYTYMPED